MKQCSYKREDGRCYHPKISYDGVIEYCVESACEHEELEETVIKPCPFCGGNASITGKNCAFGGQNFYGKKMLKYRIRVKCNKCHTMGKPFTTHWFSTEDHTFWDFKRGLSEDEIFQKYADKAIDAWNQRT